MNRKKVVCPCYKITKGDIADAVSDGASSFEAVVKKTRACKACGHCKKNVKKVTKKLLDK